MIAKDVFKRNRSGAIDIVDNAARQAYIRQLNKAQSDERRILQLESKVKALEITMAGMTSYLKGLKNADSNKSKI